MPGVLIWQCEACRQTVKPWELRQVQRVMPGHRLHIGCLPERRQRQLLTVGAGATCLFCAVPGFTVSALIDHFNREHGRVLVNW